VLREYQMQWIHNPVFLSLSH